jgi:5-methylcytosine-specific restriction protein A
MSEQRSNKVRAYRKWYFTARWRALRAAQLKEYPLCIYCLQAGARTVAVVADHTVRHDGNPELFWDPQNLTSLCKQHHDSSKQRAEHRGYSSAVGDDGWPTDSRHPVNTGRLATYRAVSQRKGFTPLEPRRGISSAIRPEFSPDTSPKIGKENR